jgi:two-component system, OmpR family, alkaline phosphatase synthesis response regulator PhoP
MKQAHGLVSSMVNGHGGAEPPLLVHVVGHAQMGHQGAMPKIVGLFSVLGGESHRGKVTVPIFVDMEAERPKYRVLLVEDEAALRTTLKLNLEMEGYSVTTAVTGPEALERLRGARFDLVLMDVMLPGMDGFTVVETIRLEGDATPVLFLTARNTPADRLRGLKAGDDHVAKPYDLAELLLRIANLIQRSSKGGTSAVITSFDFGGNHVDFTKYEVVGQDGERRTLSQREMMLLRLLIEREGEVVSREEILQKVWGYNVFPTTRTVDNFIVAFRKYFEPDARTPRHFHSVRGVGYKFVA